MWVVFSRRALGCSLVSWMATPCLSQVIHGHLLMAVSSMMMHQVVSNWFHGHDNQPVVIPLTASESCPLWSLVFHLWEVVEQETGSV